MLIQVDSILGNMTDVVEESLNLELFLSEGSIKFSEIWKKRDENEGNITLGSRISYRNKTNLASNGKGTPMTRRQRTSHGCIRRKETLDAIHKQLVEARSLIRKNYLNGEKEVKLHKSLKNFGKKNSWKETKAGRFNGTYSCSW